ncbi:hypothetical protein H0H93_007801 [Arthromyces matolae]|nr:hypothetical protein H0H93_007801 [Arthromyces matolae]
MSSPLDETSASSPAAAPANPFAQLVVGQAVYVELHLHSGDFKPSRYAFNEDDRVSYPLLRKLHPGPLSKSAAVTLKKIDRGETIRRPAIIVDIKDDMLIVAYTATFDSKVELPPQAIPYMWLPVTPAPPNYHLQPLPLADERGGHDNKAEWVNLRCLHQVTRAELVSSTQKFFTTADFTLRAKGNAR